MNISILGDSISTYSGVSNDARANASIRNHPAFYRPPFPLEKTYWSRLIEAFGLSLCVNNAWSGGNLSGRDHPESGVNRAGMLSRDDGTQPDLIIVFMGINDLGRRVDTAVFAADYKRTLMTIREQYPAAAVCCVNLPDRDVSMKEQTERFNRAIENAAASMGQSVFIADLFHSRLNNDCYYLNTLDGLHPDEDGMRIIAEVIEASIKRHYQGKESPPQ